MTEVALPDLVARVGRGDAEAFAEFYGRTYDGVRHFLASAASTKPALDLDDQLVAAYVRIWRQARTCPPDADVWPWIDATVRPVRHPVRPTLRAAARPRGGAVSGTSP